MSGSFNEFYTFVPTTHFADFTTRLAVDGIIQPTTLTQSFNVSQMVSALHTKSLWAIDEHGDMIRCGKLLEQIKETADEIENP